MGLAELFWNASVEELANGYIYDSKDEKFTCLICGDNYFKGIIYQDSNLLLEAEKAIKVHITQKHKSTLDYLLNMNKKYTGLTDHQIEVIKYFFAGFSDKEIISELDIGSTSTIRNYRFKLKEKEKQAKIFLAIMSLLNETNQGSNNLNKQLIGIHKGATMVDERYAITEEEREKVLKTYFDLKTGKMNKFPGKEKRKIIALQYIVKSFATNKKYTEKEVNEILKGIYDDFVTIRRYLIEYGYMERNKDGSAYWVKL